MLTKLQQSASLKCPFVADPPVLEYSFGTMHRFLAVYNQKVLGPRLEAGVCCYARVRTPVRVAFASARKNGAPNAFFLDEN